MSKIVLIGGYCAAGKSTFAHALSKQTNTVLLCKDTLKEQLADSLGKENVRKLPNLSYTVFDLMLHLTQKFLGTSTNLILEANFNPSEAQRLSTLTKGFDAQALTILFHGDEKTLFNRYIQRESMRHWVHISMEESYEDFCKYMPPTLQLNIGTTMQIDTTTFDDALMQNAQKRAIDFLKD